MPNFFFLLASPILTLYGEIWLCETTYVGFLTPRKMRGEWGESVWVNLSWTKSACPCMCGCVNVCECECACVCVGVWMCKCVHEWVCVCVRMCVWQSMRCERMRIASLWAHIQNSLLFTIFWSWMELNYFSRGIFFSPDGDRVFWKKPEQHFTNIRATYVWSGHNAKRIRVGQFSALGTGWGVA